MTSSYLDHLQRPFSTGAGDDECSIFWTHNSIQPVTWGKAREDAGPSLEGGSPTRLEELNCAGLLPFAFSPRPPNTSINMPSSWKFNIKSFLLLQFLH